MFPCTGALGSLAVKLRGGRGERPRVPCAKTSSTSWFLGVGFWDQSLLGETLNLYISKLEFKPYQLPQPPLEVALARADAGEPSTFERQQREQIQQDLGEGFRHPVLLVQPVSEEERIAACSVARHVEQPNVGLPAAVVRSHLCGIQGPRWPAGAALAADWSRLAGAWGSLGHDLAMKAASREPARRNLCQLILSM